MTWSICETAGSLAQGSCLSGIFTQDDPDIVVIDALDTHKMYIISKLLFARIKVY